MRQYFSNPLVVCRQCDERVTSTQIIGGALTCQPCGHVAGIQHLGLSNSEQTMWSIDPGTPLEQLPVWMRDDMRAVESLDRQLEQVSKIADKIRSLEQQTVSGDLLEIHTIRPDLNLTAHVQNSIYAAFDHLAAASLLWTQFRGAPPMAAWASVCRPALLCASQAVWLLHPETQSERLDRGLRFNRGELNDERTIAFLLANHGLDDYTLGEAQRRQENLEKRTRQIDAEMKERGVKERGCRPTDVIDEAVHILHTEASRRLEAKMFWVTSSGAAHGRLWAVGALAHSEITHKTLVAARNSVETYSYLSYFRSGVEMLELAFGLYQRRSGSEDRR